MKISASLVTLRTGALTLFLSTALTGCGLLGDGSGGDAGGRLAAGAKGRSFTVAAAGDVLIHPELTAQAEQDGKAAGKGGMDFGPIMASVKPVISKADLAICHMEPVLGKPEGPFLSFPDFLVPPQIATTLKDIGYDTCSTASNHALDHGEGGVKDTLDTLDKAGLKHTGSARDEKEGTTPLIMDVKGVKVAQISFAGGFNGRQVPADKPWLVNKTSLDAISAAEKAARAAGAEVVILSIHWGKEHQPAPNSLQLSLAKKISERTGINLVIGHHAHVVQPMEKVGDIWVAYGLGNQVARHEVPSGLSEEGVIGWFEFAEKNGKWDVQARYVPTFVELPPDLEVADPAVKVPDTGQVKDHRLIDLTTALKNGSAVTPERRARYELAYERTQGTLLNRGGGKDGLEPLTSR
ncbi:CapA family protein [Streptomyces sp. TBY4]|uniref:CapA family protein n=1 Tax=Streptomyces sp. TBY4 TaxID=2962030 RepID=UPI0020B63EF3|nr:CapA family protein [Streptomyces sp. TBY4]MCP3755797.1 CapA family protein [Streptomyces sp. TBY4]